MKRIISVILFYCVIFISGCASPEYSGKGGMTEFEVKSEAYEYHYKHGYTGEDALEWDPDLQYAWSRVGAALTCNIEINKELILKNMSEKYGNSPFIHESNGIMFHHLQSKKINNFCTKDRISEIKEVIVELEHGHFPHTGVASNYDPDLLFNIEDLKNIFEIDVSFDEKHILDRRDFYSGDRNKYFQKYRFKNLKGISINTTLMIAKEVTEAERYFVEYQAGVLIGLSNDSEKLKYKKESNNVVDGKYDFYTIYTKKGQTIGNFIIIKVKNKVYHITVVGAYFESFSQLCGVFQRRLIEILSFEPL